MIVDGKVLQTFEDPVGVPGRGNAISFYWQRAGAPLEITGFRISEWNGVMEDLRQDDMDGGHRKIRLVNKDSFEGEVMEIRDEQARLKTPFLEFEVPIRRISHLEFVPSVTNLTGFENGQVRAWFENRGSLSLAVEDFKSDRVVGTNPNLGRIRLNPEWMDRLQFNPMNESPGDEGRLPEIDDPDWPEE